MDWRSEYMGDNKSGRQMAGVMYRSAIRFNTNIPRFQRIPSIHAYECLGWCDYWSAGS